MFFYFSTPIRQITLLNIIKDDKYEICKESYNKNMKDPINEPRDQLWRTKLILLKDDY